MRIIFLSLTLLLAGAFHQDAYATSTDMIEQSQKSIAHINGGNLTVEDDNTNAILNYFNTLRRDDPVFEDIENITIKSPDLEILPNTIGIFKKLKTLDISYTNIYSLRDTINDQASSDLIEMLTNGGVNIVKRKNSNIKGILHFVNNSFRSFDEYIVDLEKNP